MTERAQLAARIAGRWPAGVCHFCGIRDEQVDGDRIRWINDERSVCSQVGCVRQFNAEIGRAAFAGQRKPRKRTPADISELKEQERRQRAAAARARRKGRVA